MERVEQQLTSAPIVFVGGKRTHGGAFSMLPTLGFRSAISIVGVGTRPLLACDADAVAVYDLFILRAILRLVSFFRDIPENRHCASNYPTHIKESIKPTGYPQVPARSVLGL
jgi:hypothetical protein